MRLCRQCHFNEINADSTTLHTSAKRPRDAGSRLSPISHTSVQSPEHSVHGGFGYFSFCELVAVVSTELYEMAL